MPIAIHSTARCRLREPTRTRPRRCIEQETANTDSVASLCQESSSARELRVREPHWGAAPQVLRVCPPGSGGRIGEGMDSLTNGRVKGCVRAWSGVFVNRRCWRYWSTLIDEPSTPNRDPEEALIEVDRRWIRTTIEHGWMNVSVVGVRAWAREVRRDSAWPGHHRREGA